MSNDKLAEIRKLAVRLQTAAYDHGSVDASDHWSDQKYADADDRSRSALTTLMDAVSDTLQAHAAAAPQPQAAEPVGYVDQQGGVIWYVDDLSWSRKPKAGTEVYTHPQPPAQDAKYESLCKDAKRYRWLINKLPPGTFYDADVYDVDSWASAIDAAMAQESGR